MKCPKCEAENRDAAKFCGRCRSKLSWICPQCNSENPPDNTFCDQCGYDLIESKEAPPLDYSELQSYNRDNLRRRSGLDRRQISGPKYILRSIDPWSGFMKDFELEPDEPVLIGRMPLEIILEYPESFLINTPDEEVETLADFIGSTKRLITMEECKIPGNPISRVHCMIFPAQETKILDLYSTNGTVLANIDGGIQLEPGKRSDLQHNTIILAAKGSAIFQYFSFDDSEKDDMEREEDMVTDITDFNLNE